MAHYINLAMQFFYVQTLVSKLEWLLQTMYTYFSFLSKRHLEHGTCTMLLETKALKLFHNVKTRWISILSHTKQVLTKYIILVVKMNDDLHIVV